MACKQTLTNRTVLGYRLNEKLRFCSETRVLILPMEVHMCGTRLKVTRLECYKIYGKHV